MSIRWYTVVVDCQDVVVPRAAGGQRRWTWRIAVEADDEVVLVPPHALDPTRQEPALRAMPRAVFVSVPEVKPVKNLLHIDLAPPPDGDQAAEVRRLEALGPAGRHRPGLRTPSAGWSWPILRATSSACSPRATEPRKENPALVQARRPVPQRRANSAANDAAPASSRRAQEIRTPGGEAIRNRWPGAAAHLSRPCPRGGVRQRVGPPGRATGASRAVPPRCCLRRRRAPSR